MLKITAVLSLLFIVSSVWSAGSSCGSCGPECAPSCGTRRFRSCCFNYLRRKRGPDALKEQNFEESKPKSKSAAMFTEESIPVYWTNKDSSNENQLYYAEDTIANHFYD